MNLILLLFLIVAIIIGLVICYIKQHHISKNISKNEILMEHFNQNLKEWLQYNNDQQMKQQQRFHEFQHHFDKQQLNSLKILQDTLRGHIHDIGDKVEKRLHDGFKKTDTIVTDVYKHLTLLDDAQKKITELTTNVVSLQEILNDKRSRGALGETQLANLITNMIPPGHFHLQYTLDNHKRADCIILLPPPNGNIVIDAKFPLENYQKMSQIGIANLEQKQHQQQFKQDIKKHIDDVATKYILPPQTTDSAILFIPAEAIFAEIHSRHQELVSYAQKQRIWLVSPTTLMATLTIIKSILKDVKARKHAKAIQNHLIKLAEDFRRFDQRMTKLAQHIRQADQDVDQINKSAKKICQSFQKIERVEIKEQDES